MKRENPFSDFLREVGGAFIIMLMALAVCLLAGLLCGCSPKVVSPSETSHDTIYIAKQLHDSVHVHDSIFVNQYTQGDTVFLTKYKYKEYWREKQVHDTIIHCSTDTIKVDVVEYRQTRNQVFYSEMGRLFIWLIAGLALFALFWLLYWKLTIKH